MYLMEVGQSEKNVVVRGWVFGIVLWGCLFSGQTQAREG